MASYEEEQRKAIEQWYAAAGLPSPFRKTVPLEPAAFGKGPEYTTDVPSAPSTPAPSGAEPPIGGWQTDLGYQEALAWAENQRNQADAQYAAEVAGLGSSTGLYDASGGSVDQTQIEQLNPFSQAGMLRRAWRQAQTGTLNSYAAGGQLYSGALRNASGVTGDDPRSQLYEDQRGGYNSFNYQANLGGLKDQYNQSKAALDRWRLGVTGDVDERLLDESQEARDRWLEQRPALPAPARYPDSAVPQGNKGFYDPNAFERIPRETTTKGQSWQGSTIVRRAPKRTTRRAMRRVRRTV